MNKASTFDPIRADQTAAGLAMSREAANDNEPAKGGWAGETKYPPRFKPQVKAKKATGHEAFLKAIETSGGSISVEKKSSGRILIGKIMHSDKYTISLKVADELYGASEVGTVSGFTASTRVIFKSDISEFSALQASPEAANDLPVIFAHVAP